MVNHIPLWSTSGIKLERPIQPFWVAPNINAYPKAQNSKAETPKSQIFFRATFILFLLRVNPDSKQRNPACMRNTALQQKVTQRTSIRGFSINPSLKL